jgi:type I restriction enzyme S subunit
MANKWSNQKIGDVCEINQSKRDNKWNHPIIEYIDISSVGVGHLIDEPTLISIKEAPSRAQRLVQDGDTIVSTVRPNRRSMLYIKSPKQNTVVSTGFAVLHPKNINPRFLYYTVFNQEFTDYLTARADGSAYPAVSPEVIADAELELPPLAEQRVIAETLGALDDKIEVNRRMNATLESMARTVFHQWFVENEEVGKWEEIDLRQFADVIDCMHTKKPDRQSDGKPLLQLWNILDDGLLDMTDTYFISEERYKHWVSRIEASPGDCVITNTGRVAAIAQIPEGYKAALGRNMTSIRCKKESQFPTFLMECLRSNTMRQEIDRKTDVGTILNSLNVRNIPTLRFRRPPKKLMAKFEKTVRPIRAMMEKNLAQSRTLANLRDSLLPKLMRGEVRVKDVAD